MFPSHDHEGRAGLQRSEDQKKQDAQTEMFNAFTQMFQQVMVTMMAQGNMSPDAQTVMDMGQQMVEDGKIQMPDGNSPAGNPAATPESNAIAAEEGGIVEVSDDPLPPGGAEQDPLDINQYVDDSVEKPVEA